MDRHNFLQTNLWNPMGFQDALDFTPIPEFLGHLHEQTAYYPYIYGGYGGTVSYIPDYERWRYASDLYSLSYDRPFIVRDDYSDDTEVSEKEFMRVLTA